MDEKDEGTRTIDINLEEFTKEQLMQMINICHQKNCTFNEFIIDTLDEIVNTLDTNINE